MRYLPIIARILLGLIFFVFGLNGLHPFMPQPKDPMPAGALAFVTAMIQTGYILKLLAGTQTLAGFLLLINRFVPLALTLLAPVVVNIILFHTFLAPAPAAFAPGTIALILELYLAWSYRAAFRSMLAAKVTPGGN
jgi:uncharacterized membrane protein YphA (DoxX/SURF4 family)